jgi:hypothetical protein
VNAFSADASVENSRGRITDKFKMNAAILHCEVEAGMFSAPKSGKIHGSFIPTRGSHYMQSEELNLPRVARVPFHSSLQPADETGQSTNAACGES